MSNLTIDKQTAIAEYKAADKKGKALLEKLYGKETFTPSPLEIVKSFEDACKVLGLDASTEIPSGLPKHVEAYMKLCTIAKALNNGWQPDWNDEDQYKYFNWFEWTGKGFSFFNTGYYYRYTDVGSRLCFVSSEVAKYAAKQFIDLYREFLTIES